MRIRRRSWILVLGLLLATSAPLAAQAPVVHAVLFYSPACPHCHKVINEDLPPLVQRYGDRLMIVGVDVTTENGQMMFRDAADHYGIPLTQLGVPLMVVDDQVLMGDQEIPQRLPGIVDAGLARGGTGWPDLPLLHDALVAQGLIKDAGTAVADSEAAAPAAAAPADAGQPAAEQPTATSPSSETTASATPGAEATPGAPMEPAAAPASAASPNPESSPAGETPAASAPNGTPPSAAATSAEAEPQPAAGAGASSEAPGAPAREGVFTGLEGAATALKLTMGQRFALDPVANSVALVVLLFMIGVATAALSMIRRGRTRFGAGPAWWIPLLSAIGLGIALYLSFVEVSGTEAVCGPVGDCNTVQQSVYARVLGMPVGVLGAIGYVAIFVLWALARGGRGVWREHGAAGLWSATFTGVLFSIYLTFLEPFVIGASCAWCLGSALVMTLLLIAATGVLGSIRQPAGKAPSSQPPALV